MTDPIQKIFHVPADDALAFCEKVAELCPEAKIDYRMPAVNGQRIVKITIPEAGWNKHLNRPESKDLHRLFCQNDQELMCNR